MDIETQTKICQAVYDYKERYTKRITSEQLIHNFAKPATKIAWAEAEIQLEEAFTLGIILDTGGVIELTGLGLLRLGKAQE